MFPHLYLAFRLYSFYLEILCFIITKKFYCFPADPLSGYDNRASRWVEICVFQRNVSFTFFPRNLFCFSVFFPFCCLLRCKILLQSRKLSGNLYASVLPAYLPRSSSQVHRFLRSFPFPDDILFAAGPQAPDL